jgi:hypothetical protein
MVLFGGHFLIVQNWIRGSQATLALLAGACCFVFGTIISAAKAGAGKGPSKMLARELELVKIELFGVTSNIIDDRSGTP